MPSGKQKLVTVLSSQVCWKETLKVILENVEATRRLRLLNYC